eukprot:TRINITY_DN3079_c0_g1_i2.p1 TRINITY_DN3079_c0_g1~~TRINITY_DN3079_c0_g1_i2.p1  ORF type:complete len:110 (+),score=35.67 TRINITY_DN3079_c0_g1_i2:303-632(+)
MDRVNEDAVRKKIQDSSGMDQSISPHALVGEYSQFSKFADSSVSMDKGSNLLLDIASGTTSDLIEAFINRDEDEEVVHQNVQQFVGAEAGSRKSSVVTGSDNTFVSEGE